MFTIEMDKRPIEQLENDLDRFGKQALPYAAKDTLNTAAYKSSDLAKRNLDRVFTQRNTWTKRSIRYQRVIGRDIRTMESAMGSTLEYMRLQEEGFTQHKSGKHGVAIPTGAAAGQMGAKKRTRRLQRKNWLANVSPARGRGRGKGSTVTAVRDAVETGRRVVFIDSPSDHYGRPTGFYRVVGGRKGGHGWPKGAKLQMIYSVERSSVRTDPHKWMESPVRLIMKNIGKIYRDALIRQIRINRSFRNRG
jgi:hypothetical protein